MAAGFRRPRCICSAPAVVHQGRGTGRGEAGQVIGPICERGHMRAREALDSGQALDSRPGQWIGARQMLTAHYSLLRDSGSNYGFMLLHRIVDIDVH